MGSLALNSASFFFWTSKSASEWILPGQSRCLNCPYSSINGKNSSFGIRYSGSSALANTGLLGRNFMPVKYSLALSSHEFGK